MKKNINRTMWVIISIEWIQIIRNFIFPRATTVFTLWLPRERSSTDILQNFDEYKVSYILMFYNFPYVYLSVTLYSDINIKYIL